MASKSEIKIFTNETKKEEDFPVLIDYSDIKYTPQTLSDINAEEGNKLNIAIDANGNVITELINSKLNTATKQILDGFTFGTSGAIQINIDANNGIWISPSGILAKKGGITKFALTTDGDATFAGTLSGASGTFGTITSGTLSGVTITGGTLQTATSYQRVVISGSENAIHFYDSYGHSQGTIYGNSAGGGMIYTDGNFGVTGWESVSGNLTAYRVYVNAGSGSGIEPTWNNSVTCGSSNKRWSNVYSTKGDFSSDVSVSGNIAVSGTTTVKHILPYSDNSYDIGNTSYYFRNICMKGYLCILGKVMGNLSPYTDTGYDLGTSSYRWGSLYVNFVRLSNGFLNLAQMSGSTASGIPCQNGSMYYRTDDNTIRVYVGGSWKTVVVK